MAPRRSKENTDLPDNLYYTNAAKGKYYYYRHPITGHRTSFGYDRTESVKAAKQLNQILGAESDLIAKVQTGHPDLVTVGDYFLHYKTQVLPTRRINGHPLSPEYLQETKRVLARIEEGIGSKRAIVGVTQTELAAYLNKLSSSEVYNQHRKRMVQVWAYAVSDGIVPENLPEKIIKRDKDVRQRERLTLAGYKAIYGQATPAIRHAMELSLNALQRRADIQKWQFKDQAEGFAYIIQSKTRKHGKCAYLRIPLTLPVVYSETGAKTLADIIAKCRDNLACPHLIHHKPKRVRPSKEKKHAFQLSRKEISDGFREARDASGMFDGMEPAQRPSFHELLALGEHLREKQGWTPSEIQVLRGHTNERTTKIYLEGHEWQTVVIPGKR